MDPRNAFARSEHVVSVRTKEGGTMESSMEGAVFVQTNAAHNEVIAFSRAATGDATILGFRLVDGDLVPIDGSMGALSTPDGAQVGFTPDGRALIATERGGDKLSSFAVGMDGTLGERRTIDSLGATPYGFAI